MRQKAKIAVAAPEIRLCDAERNAELCIKCAEAANEKGADIIVFPELTLTGATCGDLYFQELLTEKADAALSEYIEKTAELDIMSFIGLPIACGGALYNAVACVSQGEIIGISASGTATRHFAPAPEKDTEVTVAGRRACLGRSLVYTDGATGADIFVKVGDDGAFSNDGVNIILNPSADCEYIGLAAARRKYACDVSGELGVAFVIAGAGDGESGTDGIYAAPRLVAQSGRTVAEAPLFSADILYAEIEPRAAVKTERETENASSVPRRFPFIPEDETERCEACALALEIQARALALRMERAYARHAVIGVSGGLDSTLAVLAAVKAAKLRGLSSDSVIAITMPCFGTTERTKSNALALARELGCTVRTVDIKAAVTQHFKDISHGEDDYDVVYENAQARERTQVLMDVANGVGGLVVGTGDLSELALGFATYNGDHMSMYCVNGSVPKTLMRAIITYAAHLAKKEGRARLFDVLFDVVNTPVSPELLPTENGENSQHTESIVGPYELHDFFLYHTVKYGTSPSKIYKLATEVFSEYSADSIGKYLEVFVRRFFSQQFKRSCMPDGPRVTEISLSPRGSWQMPSDASAALWRADIPQESKQ